MMEQLAVSELWNWYTMMLLYSEAAQTMLWKNLSDCPVSWEREWSCWCMTASPKVNGLPQLGMIHANFLISQIRQALLWGEKNSCHVGHRGDSFSSRKELHISVDGWLSTFSVENHLTDTLSHGEETWCTCLRMFSCSLCWVPAICYLHGMFQVWQAGSGLSGDLQNKVVCLLLLCCGHGDTEEDFANVEFWLKTSMQNFVICGFCQVLWLGLSSASKNWADFLSQEGFLSSLLMQWILWLLQILISSFVW